MSYVSIVPMRNWNFTSFDYTENLDLEFLSYLWGIETLFRQPDRSRRDRFYRTYEELKPTILLAVNNVAAVSIVPMRNWNYRVVHTTYQQSAVSIVPMRNWNLPMKVLPMFLSKFLSYLWGIETHFLADATHSHQRFYRTYEELKLASHPLRTIPFVSSFYRTYEELKPGFAVGTMMLLRSFYRTYEELKLR